MEACVEKSLSRSEIGMALIERYGEPDRLRSIMDLRKNASIRANAMIYATDGRWLGARVNFEATLNSEIEPFGATISADAAGARWMSRPKGRVSD
jgi:hypothetical protein